MWRLSKMVMPEASQREGDKAIITFNVHQSAKELEPIYVTPTDPVSPEMCERGGLARRAFEILVDA